MTTTRPPRTALEEARALADTILYEGYVLYPYRASSQKNRERFQFGVLMPPAYTVADPSEESYARTECLLECGDHASVRILVRFLQLQRRSEPGAPPWDEAVEHEHACTVPIAALAEGPLAFPIRAEAVLAHDSDPDGGSMTTRRREALAAALTVAGERVAGPFNALKLSARLENLTEPPPQSAMTRRADALPHALVSAHLLFDAPGCAFVSMTDPPRWAAEEVARCRNERTWPVLAGPPGTRELLLSCPVILYDHPRLAPESPADLYDATEIDEILTLRTMTLTDAEKAEARATDPRAAELIDRVDGLPPEQLDRLHGALRYLRHVTGEDERPAQDDVPAFFTPDAPWWDPGADASVSPATDAVMIDGVPVARGSRVRLRPGRRRADAQDAFLHGSTAVVEAVLFDVDGNVHVGVVPDADGELAELQRWHGRFLYFAPDEIEPITESVRR